MADFDYELPEDLVAQVPLPERDASRLLVLDRQRRSWTHRQFRELPELLDPGDLLVVNDSRVIPGRLAAHKRTGARIEVLLLQRQEDGNWRALVRPARRVRSGDELIVHARRDRLRTDAVAVIESTFGDGVVHVRLASSIEEHLDDYGTAPLPPYVGTPLEDEERYQTIFGFEPGSAAAPTAGLHFSDAIMHRLAVKDVRLARVTLHVGVATFRPVSTEFADQHQIHSEWCTVGEEAARSIELAVHEGRRVVSVGTTAARTLETFGQRLEQGRSGPFEAETSLFITPGYRWRMVGALITNFHVPRSTLLLMVSAFACRNLVLDCYRDAVREHYRFLSFGDAMLIV